MSKERSQLRLLLLQIRDQAQVRREEHESFARYCQLDPQQIDILNVFDTTHFKPAMIDGYDALLVGGASEASVLEPETYLFIQSCEDILLYCLEQNIPVFASCFGFQLAILALGGEIIRDTENYEIGVIPIQLTELGQHDIIFAGVPNNFMAVSVHHEMALALPENCELLATTDHCLHSFRVKNKPFWAFQFHPEVDKQTLVERLTFFKKKYTQGDGHLEEVLASAVETPYSNHLMKTFVDRVLLS